MGAMMLVALIWLVEDRLLLVQQGLPSWLRLSALLVANKPLADLLEWPFRPQRATFYYEDYLGEWLHYTALGLVAVLSFVLAQVATGQALRGAPVAIGVYVIWRITSPHRRG